MEAISICMIYFKIQRNIFSFPADNNIVIYDKLSFVNHSCDENSTRTANTQSLVATKNIKRGEEIT